MFSFFNRKKKDCSCKNKIVEVKLNLFSPKEFAPAYAHEGDAGADVRAFRSTNLNLDPTVHPNDDFRSFGYDLQPGETHVFGCGFNLQLPKGYAFFVCPRSGLAAKKSVTVLNAPGICDSGYTGEYGVILHNAGKEVFHVAYGDRIAQIVLVKVPHANFVESAFTYTERGTGGFGSTGKK